MRKVFFKVWRGKSRAGATHLFQPGQTFVTGAELIVDGGMTRKMIYEGS